MDIRDLYLYGVLGAFSLFALVLGYVSVWSKGGKPHA